MIKRIQAVIILSLVVCAMAFISCGSSSSDDGAAAKKNNSLIEIPKGVAQ